jgi:hypothetical protein
MRDTFHCLSLTVDLQSPVSMAGIVALSTNVMMPVRGMASNAVHEADQLENHTQQRSVRRPHLRCEGTLHPVVPRGSRCRYDMRHTAAQAQAPGCVVTHGCIAHRSRRHGSASRQCIELASLDQTRAYLGTPTRPRTKRNRRMVHALKWALFEWTLAAGPGPIS